MRPLGWALIRHDQGLYKKKRSEHRRTPRADGSPAAVAVEAPAARRDAWAGALLTPRFRSFDFQSCGPCISILSFCVSVLRLPQQNAAAWGAETARISFSKFWRLEGPGQGAGEAGCTRDLHPWLVDGHPLSVSFRHLLFVLSIPDVSSWVKSPLLIRTPGTGMRAHPRGLTEP